MIKIIVTTIALITLQLYLTTHNDVWCSQKAEMGVK